MSPAREKLRVGYKPFITLGAAILCSIALALSLFAVLWVFTHGTPRSRETRAIANESCAAALKVRDGMVKVLQNADLATPPDSPQADQAHEFYIKNIGLLESITC